MFDFEKFPVYQEAERAYALLINDVLKENNIRSQLRDQLERASSSIVLNIAEGAGRFSKMDKKNFYLTARSSTQECVAAIRILRIEGKIHQQHYDLLYKHYEQIGKMLTGLINCMLSGSANK